MPFSILLLTAASPKRHISGKGQDKVILGGDPKSGELVLFFQIDEDKIAKALNMLINKDKKKCCDGLIFYSPEQESPKTICLVEMKSNDLQKAEEQIKDTKDHLMKILTKECEGDRTLIQGVRWKAYIYRRSSSPKQTEECRKRLESTYGFGKGNVAILGQNDISSFLRGTGKSRATKE